MSRVHLFEFEDQVWLPRFLRDFMTDWLDFMNQTNSGWDAFALHLASLLHRSGSNRIIDLCSGGGGPVLRLRRVLAETQNLEPHVLLTDKFPNADARERVAAASDGDVEYHASSVDATDVPPELGGVRTMFCSFHHFRPEVARCMLASAHDGGRTIGVFEATARTVPAIAVTLLAPLAVLLTTPFVRPFRWNRLLFTYVIPILPLLILWDGLASCVRSYSAVELRDLVRHLESDAYSWDIGELQFPRTPIKVAYLIGRPESIR